MRVYSPASSNYFEKSKRHETKLVQHDDNASPQQKYFHQHHNVYYDDRMLWSLPIKCGYFFAFILVSIFMQHCTITAAANDDRISGALGFKSHMRSPKIANIHILQAVAESLPKNQYEGESVTAINNHTKLPPAGKFEIRSVSGEPNYKSVNLTWEVEFVPSDQDAITNSSREVQPPVSFQVFFCEIQSFGSHRCRSKVVNGTNSLHLYDNVDNDLEDIDQTRQVRQYMTQVDNLRMATKYSFHIRSLPKHKHMKVTGRSELFENEIEGGDILSNNIGQSQTIVIPTKGFSAQATKCLPTASEIEVETGPYFGGKIVVDGGNCGIKGDPNDFKDKYIMRIDHKICGSMVKPETNTVETFITVQENLGIFTHSTRRFVVVCSYQSGLQTVRASFSVPGRGGAAAVQQYHYEEDERMGRGLKPIRYVDKSALVLKETGTTEINGASEETEAMVEEMDNPTLNNNYSDMVDADTLAMDDTTNAIATLENIIPGVNEEHIKQTEVNENKIYNKNYKQHEKELKQKKEYNENSNFTSMADNDVSNEGDGPDLRNDAHEQFAAKFAKYTLDINDQLPAELRDDNDSFEITPTGRGFGSSLQHMTLNMGSVFLTVLLSVILIGIFIYVLYRETNLPPPMKTSSSNSSHRHHHHKHLQEVETLPRTLRTKNQDILA